MVCNDTEYAIQDLQCPQVHSVYFSGMSHSVWQLQRRYSINLTYHNHIAWNEAKCRSTLEQAIHDRQIHTSLSSKLVLLRLTPKFNVSFDGSTSGIARLWQATGSPAIFKDLDLVESTSQASLSGGSFNALAPSLPTPTEKRNSPPSPAPDSTRSPRRKVRKNFLPKTGANAVPLNFNRAQHGLSGGPMVQDRGGVAGPAVVSNVTYAPAQSRMPPIPEERVTEHHHHHHHHITSSSTVPAALDPPPMLHPWWQQQSSTALPTPVSYLPGGIAASKFDTWTTDELIRSKDPRKQAIARGRVQVELQRLQVALNGPQLAIQPGGGGAASSVGPEASISSSRQN